MKLINKKEEKKMNIVTKVVMIIVFAVMVITFVIMRFNLKYEYVCFNRDMQKDEVVFESYYAQLILIFLHFFSSQKLYS